jgi:hypothetical protein
MCCVSNIACEWMYLGVAKKAQNSEFEYRTGQNVSPPLRFVLATAGITALSVYYTGKTDSRSRIEEIPRLLWNPQVQYRIHNSLSHHLTVFAKEASPHCPTIFLQNPL